MFSCHNKDRKKRWKLWVCIWHLTSGWMWNSHRLFAEHPVKNRSQSGVESHSGHKTQRLPGFVFQFPFAEEFWRSSNQQMWTNRNDSAQQIQSRSLQPNTNLRQKRFLRQTASTKMPCWAWPIPSFLAVHEISNAALQTLKFPPRLESLLPRTLKGIFEARLSDAADDTTGRRIICRSWGYHQRLQVELVVVVVGMMFGSFQKVKNSATCVLDGCRTETLQQLGENQRASVRLLNWHKKEPKLSLATLLHCAKVICVPTAGSSDIFPQNCVSTQQKRRTVNLSLPCMWANRPHVWASLHATTGFLVCLRNVGILLGD